MFVLQRARKIASRSGTADGGSGVTMVELILKAFPLPLSYPTACVEIQPTQLASSSADSSCEHTQEADLSASAEAAAAAVGAAGAAAAGGGSHAAADAQQRQQPPTVRRARPPAPMRLSCPRRRRLALLDAVAPGGAGARCSPPHRAVRRAVPSACVGSDDDDGIVP